MSNTPRHRPWPIALVVSLVAAAALGLGVAGYFLTELGHDLFDIGRGLIFTLAAVVVFGVGWLLVEIAGTVVISLIAAPFVAIYRHFVPESDYIRPQPRETNPTRLTAIVVVGAVLVVIMMLL